MQEPEPSGAETARLAALKTTGLLNTQPEDKFDRLTRLAREMFGVKAALVSVVDDQRLWLKSRQGEVALNGAAREVSFTAHAIEQADIMEVTDALQDPRFQHSPLVTGFPHVRYYAGAPLTVGDGLRIGALCILDDQPRPPLTQTERQCLRDLADCVEQAIGHVDLHEQSLALQSAQRLGEVVARAQLSFIQEPDRKKAFETLLTDILSLTLSDYGFVGEVLHQSDGQPYLRTHAITNIAWDAASKAFYEQHAPHGMAFTNLNTLFGAALRTGEVVIANTPSGDPRRGGLPSGHPPLNAFLGVPIYRGETMVAMLGLANRPGGYDPALVDFLQPLLVTIGQLISAARVQQAHEQSLVELARLSRVASDTTNGVVITDQQGRIAWINEGFTRLSGYELAELMGRSPGDLLQGAETDPQTIALMRAALRRGEAFTVDVVNYHKSGQSYWVRINCNPMRDEAGVLQGFIAIESDITREKSDAERIQRHKQRLSAVIDGARIGTWEWNIQTGEAVFNERWASMLGYTLDELAPHHVDRWKGLLHPDDLIEAEALLAQHFAGKRSDYETQCRMRHKDGHWVWVNTRGRVTTWTPEGRPHLMFGTQIDISAQQQARIALQEQADYTQAVLDNIVDGLITIDQRGLIASFNPAAEQIFGYTTAEVVGHNVKMLMPSPHREAHDGYLRDYVDNGHSRVIGIGRELRGQHKSGRLFPIELAVSQITRGGVPMFVGLVRDITRRKAAEQEIERLAFYDPLTQLPNRRLLMDRLQHAMSTSKRNGQYGALLFMDLDDFKNLNDTAGHAVGDQLLQQVAERLVSTLREGDTIARLGGDEFVVILEGLHEDAEHAATRAEGVVEKIHQVLSQRYRLGDRDYLNSPSIGVTLFIDHEHSLDDLLKQADLAMYQAKSAGRNTFRFFDPQMQARLMARTQLEADLRTAVSESQFQLFFQPQVDQLGHTTGAEALLRWPHPQRGMVPPNQFIPVAEEMGLIVPIGLWVLETACQVLLDWARAPETADLTLAINISARQFRQADFVDQVKAVLARTGARPERLKLELTESMLVSNVADIIAKMSALKDIGVSFSLDDFGTGYSSLSYLKRLPLDQLKIDQSFVREICSSPNDEAIARTIVALGHSMGMAVIAEGVESEDQRAKLGSIGCLAYQGYLFGRPVPLSEWSTQR
jgi:diguanylate cyclase (GGDEF)-like protein/PAS domain S-box-containing protein